MENGNEATATSSSSSLFSQHQQTLQQDTSSATSPSDCNLNSTELSTTITAAGTQFLSLTLNSGCSNKINCSSISNPCTTTIATTSTNAIPPSALLHQTAGISLNKNNNYLNSNNGAASGRSSDNSIISMARINEQPERFNSLQFNDEIVEQNIGEIVEYCEVVEDQLSSKPEASSSSYSDIKPLSIIEDSDNDVEVCQSKALASTSELSTLTFDTPLQSRKIFLSCFKEIVDRMAFLTNIAKKRQIEKSRLKSQDRHSINNPILHNTKQRQQQPQRNSIHSPSTSTTPNPSLNLLPITTLDLPPTISTSSSSNELTVKVPSNSKPAGEVASGSTGPIVHSQIDFVHYLVPDLESITNSSYYWGKIDRYEAERLLEGKPEGTFLLRDSAQEEFLFSVTFRKYDRSLHARIEEKDHRFSFDCHDPYAFTAPTVTGLLEHYKDQDGVMFFEPMLTIPLHRRNCFSLQKLCGATIVSNTTYDGINELELPPRLKSYLKEYHYKQKLRVKSVDPCYGRYALWLASDTV